MQNQDPGFNNGYSAGGTLQNQNLDFNNGYSAAPTTNSSANAPAANPWSQVGEPPSAPERAEDMSQAQRIAEACNCNQKIKKLYGSLKEADRLIGLLINDVVGIYKLLALRGIGETNDARRRANRQTQKIVDFHADINPLVDVVTGTEIDGFPKSMVELYLMDDNQVGKLARAVGIPTEVLDDNCPVSQRIAVLREMIRIKISD